MSLDNKSGYRDMCESQYKELTDLKVKYKELEEKLQRIDAIVSDRFSDWDMARCKIDFIINEGE